MTEIITVELEAPLWRAGKVRDAISPTLLRSGELTIGESWSWRTPLSWRLQLTGPAFQVHKVAGDVQGLGTVRYAAAVAMLALAALLAGPATANDSSRDYYSNRDWNSRVDSRAGAPDPWANTNVALQTWDKDWWKARVMIAAVQDYFNWAWRTFSYPAVPAGGGSTSPRAGYGYTRYSGRY